MVLPDILKNAPFFKKIETKSARKAANGKAKQAAQQRVSGKRRLLLYALPSPPVLCLSLSLPRSWVQTRPPAAPRLCTDPAAALLLTGRKEVGMPEKQKQRSGKNPSFN